MRTFSACLVLGVALVPSISGQTSLAQVGGTTPPQKVAELAWDALLTRCPAKPHSFFLTVDRTSWGAYPLITWEYQGVLEPVRPITLTAADRANGVEWRGRSILKAEMFREAERGSDWSAYRDASRFGTPEPLALWLEKADGHWSVFVEEVTHAHNDEHEGGLGFLLDRGAIHEPELLGSRVTCEAAMSKNPSAKKPAPSDLIMLRGDDGYGVLKKNAAIIASDTTLGEHRSDLKNYLDGLTPLLVKRCDSTQSDPIFLLGDLGPNSHIIGVTENPSVAEAHRKSGGICRVMTMDQWRELDNRFKALSPLISHAFDR